LDCRSEISGLVTDFSSGPRRRPAIVVLATALVLGLFATPIIAFAQEAIPLELGVYAPRLYFEDNVSRTRFARAVALKLSEQSGLPIRGRAFTQMGDLRAFMNAKRLDLGLVDVSMVASMSSKLRVLGVGVGSSGTAPSYAVLTRNSTHGIRSLRGNRLALVKTGPRELSLASNFALEGEVAVEKFFGTIRWASDVAEILGWLRSGQVDCTIAYASLAKRNGLHVAASLRGMPMPQLVVVRGRLTAEQRSAVEKALKSGVRIGGAWPIRRLTRASRARLGAVFGAVAQPSGRRAARRAIWSPASLERLDSKRYQLKTANDYPLNSVDDRWRLPSFPEVLP